MKKIENAFYIDEIHYEIENIFKIKDRKEINKMKKIENAFYIDEEAKNDLIDELQNSIEMNSDLTMKTLDEKLRIKLINDNEATGNILKLLTKELEYLNVGKNPVNNIIIKKCEELFIPFRIIKGLDKESFLMLEPNFVGKCYMVLKIIKIVSNFQRSITMIESRGIIIDFYLKIVKYKNELTNCKNLEDDIDFNKWITMLPVIIRIMEVYLITTLFEKRILKDLSCFEDKENLKKFLE